jgi:hypothetical protein
MSSSQQRLAAATDTRLAVVINAAANLKAQICELNELRERVSKKLLSAQKSSQPNIRLSTVLYAPKRRAFSVHMSFSRLVN